MSTIVRDAVKSDYDFLCAAFAQVNRDHCRMEPGLYREVDEIAPRWQFNALALGREVPGLRSYVGKNYCIKVAERKGHPVGAIFAWPETKKFPGSRARVTEAYLDNIVVWPGHRRGGVGTALLDAAKGWAENAGHTSLYTKIVNKNKVSLAFYKAAGFSSRSINFGGYNKVFDPHHVMGFEGSTVFEPNEAIAVVSKKRSSLSWSNFEREAHVLFRPGSGAKMNPSLLKQAQNWATSVGLEHMVVEVPVDDSESIALFEEERFTADSTNMEIRLG
ncbi:MAG: GNAT family N-acetyltransferase [Rhodospirillales bacterium]|nr:GNAT family N-acetyltransferase [Rhodospirillales bacterium]